MEPVHCIRRVLEQAKGRGPMKRSILCAVCIIFVSFFLMSCSLLKGKSEPKMPLDEVVKLSQANTDPALIVEQIKESESVYPLTIDQIFDLNSKGVDTVVLDHMFNTYVGNEKKQTRRRDITYLIIGGAVSCLLCHNEVSDQVMVIPQDVQ
jgi:hypothetical protein